MPLHPDFQKVKNEFIRKYGKEKGEEFFYRWTQKHGLDDTKPLSKQKSKLKADDGEDVNPLSDFFDDPSLEEDEPDNLTEPEAGTLPIHDGLDRLEAKEQTTKEREKLEDSEFAYPEERKLPINDAAHVRNALARWSQTDIPADKKSAVLGRICRAAKKFGIESDLCKEKGKAEAFEGAVLHVPTYKFNYTAAPKPGFGGEDGPIIIKSIVLEEGKNVNGWSVVKDEFEKVAAQYKAGKHLRVNHGKDVGDVIGKSYDGKTILGKDVELYIGRAIEGINPEGLYVAAEFEATPRDPQVRTNILKGYVETGSIGLEAEAFCDVCNAPLKMDATTGQMERTCHHNDAGVHLQNVAVKEYSYVAEPAFEHTVAYPSFSAAVSSTLKESSLLSAPASKEQMSAPAVVAEAKAEAKKPAPDDGDGDTDTDADARLQAFKDGYAEAFKHMSKLIGDAKKAEADADAEAKPKAEADAGAKPVKTDQISRVSAAPRSKTVNYDDLFDRVWNPTKYALEGGSMAVLTLKASAEAPTAPLDIRNKFKGAFR